MSTWTSSAGRALAIAGALGGAACGPGDRAAPPAGGDVPPAAVEVTAGDVRVSGPPGFCVDRGATRDDGETAFVLLAGCAAIAGEPGLPDPAVPAVLTASLSGPGSGRLAEAIPGLDAFFRGDEGRRLLSRDGDPGSVEILDSFHQGEVFFLHARDTGAGVLPNLAPDYWRAYLDVGPRIATLSVLSREAAPVPSAQGLALLREFVAAIRDPTATVAPEPSAPVAASGGTLWNIGVIRRIIG